MHRDDIQGLRGVAVLLVVLDHAGVPGFRGGFIGVDVFFVLSGFLITRLLLASAAKDGHVSLAKFYVRRARRILPAAVLTLVATDVAAQILLNFVRARQYVIDSIWASFFAANVHFAKVGTDYFSQWQPPSPIQHYWTLSVEEQFYLVWPAMLSLVAFGSITLVRPRERSGKTLTQRATVRLLFVTGIAALASFVWSVHYTRVSPTDAYFSTFVRAWELALGALLAITAFIPRSPRWPRLAGLRGPAGWLGLIGIGCAAVAYSGNTAFPGFAALLPAVGAALVIAAGEGQSTPTRFGAARILTSSPLRYVGDRSYALYLWHWPVLILVLQYEGGHLSVASKLLCALGAFALSILTYRLYENPLRRMRWPTPAGIAMWPASAAVVLVVAAVALHSIDDQIARANAATPAAPPAVLRDPASLQLRSAAAPLPAVVAAVHAARAGVPLPTSLTPPVGKLLDDAWYFPAGCAPETKQTSSQVCRLGDTSSSKTLVVMGDSFAQEWMPAILSMAQRDDWLVIPLVNGSGCASSAWLNYPKAPWCGRWYRWAVAEAKTLHPDVTLIGGEYASDGEPASATNADALIAAAKAFSRSVVVIGAAPLQSRQPVDCLLSAHATMKTCTTVIPDAEPSPYDATVAAFAKSHGVGFISPLGWFCARPSASSPQYWCPLVVNDTITRRDVGHVTVSYVHELANVFRAGFRRALFG